MKGSYWGLRGNLSPHVLQSFDLDFGEGGGEAVIKKIEERRDCGFMWLFLVGSHDTSIIAMLRTPVSQRKDSAKGINKSDFSVAT